MNHNDLAAWLGERFVMDTKRYAMMQPNKPAGREKYIHGRKPLTVADVAQALTGGTRRMPPMRDVAGDHWRVVPLSISAYTQANGLARNASIDYDHGGLDTGKLILQRAAAAGIWGFVQLSQSEKHDGGHAHFPFIEPMDASLLTDLAKRLQLAADAKGEAWPQALPFRLPCMLHLRPPDGQPRAFPLLFPTGEIVEGAPLELVEALRDRWQPNDSTAYWQADKELPKLEVIRPARLHKSKVTDPTDPSRVITWFNDNHSMGDLLETVGVQVDGRKAYRCPWHEDTSPSLGIFRHNTTGHDVCHCFAPGCPANTGPYLDAFNVFCLLNRLTTTEAVKRLASDHGLGQKRQLKTVETPQPNQATAKPYTLESHIALLAAQRHGLAVKMSDAIERRGETVIFRATPGIGKTRQARHAANEASRGGLTVAIVVPNHVHARQEWADGLDAPMIFKPRRDACTCFSREQLKLWSDKGYAAPRCTSPECPYQRQKKERQGRQVIYQYQHLYLNDGELLAGADVVIIDESPIAALVEERSATVGELEGVARRDADPVAAALAEIAQAQGQTPIYGQALIEALAVRVGDVAQAVAQARQTFKPHPPAPEVPYIDPDRMPRQFFGELLEALAHDATPGTSNPLLIWTRAKSGNSDGWRWVWSKPHTPIKAAAGKLPSAQPAIIVLDGSANPTIYQELFKPWPVSTITVGAPISPVVKVVQAPSVAPTRWWAEQASRIDGVARTVAAICNGQGIILDGGITYLKSADALAERLGGTWLHFGGQRGRNDLAEARAVGVIASPTVPPDAMLRKAWAIFANDAPINPSHERTATATYTHSDPRLQAVADLHGPEELRQAIHRARPVNRTEPATLIVCSPWNLAPLGVRPSVVVTETPHGLSRDAADALTTYTERRTQTKEADRSEGDALQQNAVFQNGSKDTALSYTILKKEVLLQTEHNQSLSLYQPVLGSGRPAALGKCAEPGCTAPAVAVTLRGQLCAECIEWHTSFQNQAAPQAAA